MAETNSSNIGFEKQIWDAACVLRGNIDASEYKSVVLGLIFLKYISDRFDAKYQELKEEGEGFEEDKDEYTAENIFFVPENARWEVIASAAHTPEIGTVIDDAMRSIEKENKRLKDILPKNFARSELDKRRLGEVVDLFTNIQMIEHGESKDILGRTYEYCLAKFAEQEGKLAGEFYTPSCVVRTLVEVLQPFNGRVYDPCCGSGGMFVQSAKFVENPGFPTVFHTWFLPGSVCGKLLRQKFQRGEALLPQARNAAENKFLASTFFSKKGSVTSFLPRFSLFSRFRIHRV